MSKLLITSSIYSFSLIPRFLLILRRVSLNDLRIIVANGESIDPVSVTDVLNANLVYLCESKTTIPGDIVDCHGIGKSSPYLCDILKYSATERNSHFPRRCASHRYVDGEIVSAAVNTSGRAG